MGWTAVKKPLYYQSPDDPELFLNVPRQYVNIRLPMSGELGRDGKPLLRPIELGIVGEEYEILQNVDAFAMADRIMADPDGPKFVSAGTLFDGRKIWLQAQLPDFIEVNGHDTVKEMLLFSNTHDGSRRVEILWTPIRVVCNNTLSMALSSSRGRIRFKHTANLSSRIEDAQDVLGICHEHHETLKASIEAMGAREPSEEEIDRVLATLFPPSDPLASVDTPQRAQKIYTIKNAMRHGVANSVAGDTSSIWALYNGVTEYVDHLADDRARVLDPMSKRVDSNWFGQGAALKSRAFDECLQLATK
jgi:phage/plasmid-like protein (TIGR03299 family)